MKQWPRHARLYMKGCPPHEKRSQQNLSLPDSFWSRVRTTTLTALTTDEHPEGRPLSSLLRGRLNEVWAWPTCAKIVRRQHSFIRQADETTHRTRHPGNYLSTRSCCLNHTGTGLTASTLSVGLISLLCRWLTLRVTVSQNSPQVRGPLSSASPS